MSSTEKLGLPLVQPAQAQKHVTVNQSLLRLDGLVNLVLTSISTTTPPAVVADGMCYGVPSGAVNAWAAQDGKVAIGANGGWEFVFPGRGWRATVLDEGGQVIHDGSGWRKGMVTLSAHNAGMAFGVQEIDHVVSIGTASVTTAIIPANAVVIGATARVIVSLTGSLTSWSLGNPGASGRFGAGIGLTAGSWTKGVLAQPTAFYSPTPLQLDANGGSFASGSVRIAVHFAELVLPDL